MHRKARETTSLVNRHLYSKADFRRPSLQETISHLCLQNTRHARFLHLRLCLYNQLKCQFLLKNKNKNSIFFGCACADKMFKQERKEQYLQTWRWNVVPNESSRDFGPCDRFWTQLALRCFLLPTLPPGTALRERYVGP